MLLLLLLVFAKVEVILLDKSFSTFVENLSFFIKEKVLSEKNGRRMLARESDANNDFAGL